MDIEIKHVGTKGEGVWDELRDWDWHIYTMDAIYQKITNENLLYSTGDSTQRSLVTEMGRKSKKAGIYVYMWLVHFVVW